MGMLGLDMSDGAKCVSVGGPGAPFPSQPLVIAPEGQGYHGHSPDGATRFSFHGNSPDGTQGHGNHGDFNCCYGDNNNCDDFAPPGVNHMCGDKTVCDVTSHLDNYQNGDHLQSLPPVCKQESEPGSCAACGGRIVDRYYLLAVDRQWHITCLRCAECKQPLDSEATCFARDGNIYCKEDYFRLFGLKRCGRCQLIISSQELVMKARDIVYHLNCFNCATCSKVLTTGEHFGMHDTMIYCRIHYEMMLQQHGELSVISGFTETSNQGQTGGHVTYYNGVGAVQKGRPRKRKSPLPVELDFHGHHLGLDDMGHYGPDGMSLQSSRQKRVRTSFKHHQLRIMKSYFALNHNPDAKDLKQLAQKTGLNKRVLQVWFQNARAKYRRNVLKQDPDKPVSGSLDGSQSAGEDTKPIRSSGSGLSDISGVRSPALSDISSSASMSDFHNSSVGAMDDSGEQNISAHPPNSDIGLSELFSDEPLDGRK